MLVVQRPSLLLGEAGGTHVHVPRQHPPTSGRISREKSNCRNASQFIRYRKFGS
jgi:hypothetical protein